MGRLPWILWVDACNQKGLYKEEAGRSELERGEWNMEAEVREEREHTAGCEAGARGHELRNAGKL